MTSVVRAATAVLLCVGLAAATAQDVQIKPARARTAQTIVTGDESAAAGADPAFDPGPPRTSAATPATATAPARKKTVAPPPPVAEVDPRVERVVFNRKPVRVALPVGRERLVSFPGTVALHVPDDAEGLVRLQVIGRTMYATALAPFGSIRVIAEDLERDGAQFPLDLVADRSTAQASGELEIALSAPRVNEAGAPRGADGQAPSADMVMLTRHAARLVYAPRRLAPTNAAIRQVPVALDPIPGLYRGARLEAAPLGAWRSGSLYVTAVRLSNREKAPLEIDLSELRGQWLAATAQHGRLGAAGDETDTTAIYLVCDRPFEACR